MKQVIKIILIIFLFSSNAISISEDNNSSENKTVETFVHKMKDFMKEEQLTKNNDLIIPKTAPINSNKKTTLKYQQSLQSYYDYKIRGFEHRTKVFEWQLFSSRLLFLIVIILVFAGIYFAAVQFYAGLKEKTLNSEQTTISLSSKSIEISSPVIGLIILALSLGFFYLYLVYVFPIEEIF